MSDPAGVTVHRDLHRLRIALDPYRDWWAEVLVALAGAAFVIVAVLMPLLPDLGGFSFPDVILARVAAAVVLALCAPAIFQGVGFAQLEIRPGSVLVRRRQFGAAVTTQIPVQSILSCTAYSQPRRLRIQTVDGDHLLVVNNTYDDLQWVVAQIEEARIRGAEPAPEPVPELLQAMLGEHRSQRVDASE